MNLKNLIGTGVAIVTPFRHDRSIDFHALGNLIEYQISNHINYIVVLGTTGESVTLTKEEKQAVINYVLETVNSRVPVVVGIGGNNTFDITEQIRKQDFDGIVAILSVSPYYNKPSQKGIYEHYKTIASASPVPVILYNVPGRTGKNICSSTAIELSKISNIIGIKEASCDIEQITEICKNTPDDFLVISGDDAYTLPIIAIGGHGVISVTANAFPKEFSEMVQHALNQDFKAASKINYSLTDIMKYHFIEGNPAGVKASLGIMKYLDYNLRLPLVPMSDENYNQLKQYICQLGYSI